MTIATAANRNIIIFAIATPLATSADADDDDDDDDDDDKSLLLMERISDRAAVLRIRSSVARENELFDCDSSSLCLCRPCKLLSWISSEWSRFQCGV